MELEKAKNIAEEIGERLSPGCERLVVAGSIRRRKPYPGDIEILAIPKYDGLADMLDREIQTLVMEGILDCRLNKLGRRVYGPKNKLVVHVPSGIGVDIFSTTDECWAVSLVVRTGGEKTNKRIAVAALRKGWHFRAYGDGYDTPKGRLHCASEREVFEAVDLSYLEPWERD